MNVKAKLSNLPLVPQPQCSFDSIVGPIRDRSERDGCNEDEDQVAHSVYEQMDVR